MGLNLFLIYLVTTYHIFQVDIAGAERRESLVVLVVLLLTIGLIA